MKKLILAFNCLMIAAGGIQASEPESKPEQFVAPIDNLPDEVILYQILPKLDNKSLLYWAQSSKKYAELFNTVLKIIKHLRLFSINQLEELIQSPDRLKKCLAEDEILKDLRPTPEQLKHYAEVELRMLAQRNEFAKALSRDGTKLDLRHKNLTVIYPGIFDVSVFKNLQRLYLAHNQLAILNSTIFKELKNLEELDIETNNLTTDQLKFYCEIQLMLKQRKYFKVKLDNDIKRLDLRSCNINSLYNGVFGVSMFKNLEELNLYGNHLTNIGKDVFNELKNLKKLDLSYCKLTNLDKDVFKELRRLKKLNLHENQLINLDKDVFKGFKNLKLLNLSNNQLTNIDKDTFKKLENLKELDLSYNKLTNLGPDMFKELKNLKKLVLDCNKLTKENINELRSALPWVDIIN